MEGQHRRGQQLQVQNGAVRRSTAGVRLLEAPGLSVSTGASWGAGLSEGPRKQTGERVSKGRELSERQSR